MISQDVLKKHWDEVKDEIQKAWNGISMAEINKVDGNRDELCDLIQRRYGLTETQVYDRMDKILAKFDFEGDEEIGELGATRMPPKSAGSFDKERTEYREDT